MATGRHGDERKPGNSNLRVILNHDERLGLLSEGSFRCRPCGNCGNSDPRLIELGGRSGDGAEDESGKGEDAERTSEAAERLKCKGCGQPYTLLASSEEDDDDDNNDALDFAGIECCKCSNREPDLFSVSRNDNGHMRSITCLVCDHGNTFHESGASPGNGPLSTHTTGSELTEPGIECLKCPNIDAALFDITRHPDGRIHKITCLACGHGNTFHDQREQAVTTGNGQRPSQLWKTVGLYMSAAHALASPVLSAAHSVVTKSAQSVFTGVSQQLTNNVQNKRPVTEGLRQVGAGQVAAIGGNLVVELGDRYLKKLLPMIPDTAAKALTRNLSEVVRQYALQLLAARQDHTTGRTKVNTPANTETKTTAKPPKDT